MTHQPAIDPPDSPETESLCDACGEESLDNVEDPRPRHDGWVCITCFDNHELAQEAMDNGAWVKFKKGDDPLSAQCWIQQHDCQMALVSFGRGESTEWIDIANIFAVQEL